MRIYLKRTTTTISCITMVTVVMFFVVKDQTVVHVDINGRHIMGKEHSQEQSDIDHNQVELQYFRKHEGNKEVKEYHKLMPSAKISGEQDSALKADAATPRQMLAAPDTGRSFHVDITKFGKLVNPHVYDYLIDPKESCSDPDIFLVAYVHVSPDHYGRRAAVRKSWANATLYPNAKIQVFFMVGRPETQSVQSMIDIEAEKYHDMVQEDFYDSYHNLSIKAIGAMRWVTSRCKQAKFILKIDDDTYMNLFTLLQHLIDLDEHHVNTTGLLMCHVWKKMHVLRTGKWEIPLDMMSGEYYPHYCSGMAYVMSPDVAHAIYRGSEYVPFFWVDDVYITGVIPKAIGLTHVDISHLMFGGKELEWLMSGKDWYKYVFSCHLRDPKLLADTWNRMKIRFQNEHIPKMMHIVAGQVATDYGPKMPPTSFKASPKETANEVKEHKHVEKVAIQPVIMSPLERRKKFEEFLNSGKL